MNEEDPYYSRLEGVVSPDIRHKNVVVVGCGASSLMVDSLVRHGVGRFDLIDFDRVETANLVRTAYRVSDVGKYKTEALAAIVSDVNPFSSATSWPVGIHDLSDQQLEQIFGRANLLIAGTDSFRANAFVNVLSCRFRVPAIFIGFHAGATGGRIVWSIPGTTPCYRCLSGPLYEASSGPTDLRGERGAPVNQSLVDTIAVKVALATLERDARSTMADFFSEMRMRTEVVVRCEPVHPYTLDIQAVLREHVRESLSDDAKASLDEVEGVLGQVDQQCRLAMDSLWLTSERKASCPDCRELYR